MRFTIDCLRTSEGGDQCSAVGEGPSFYTEQTEIRGAPERGLLHTTQTWVGWVAWKLDQLVQTNQIMGRKEGRLVLVKERKKTHTALGATLWRI